MDKNKYIVDKVAKQKVVKARCNYELMSVLDLRCYLRSLGYSRIKDTVTRSELYKILKNEPDAIHMFVEFPDGMFSRTKGAEAKKEYNRRLNLFKKN